MAKKVVIIGGGFTGSKCARSLEKDFDVTLIDNKDYFEFTPSVLRTIVDSEHANNIQALHKNYLKRADFVYGDVSKIGEEEVFIGKKKYPFDYLIVSSGSFYREPFKEENIVKPNRAKELNEYHEKLEKSESVCIIGGGLVGIEMASEIICKYPDKKIVLFHHGDKLIPRNNPKSSRCVEKFLRTKGVDLRLGEECSKKDQEGFNLVFHCIGIEPNLDFWDKNKKFEVDNYLRLKGRKNIFVGGDVSDFKEEKTAQNAERHAKFIIYNVRALEKSREMRKYFMQKRPFLISLGNKIAILEYKNLSWCGRIPAMMKNGIERRHMKRLKC